ncbi:MAG: cob(I)yrinic acid a,c-diamide adenosyltransferase [Hespellia sp.]|nr:cob(I)yrinic acid a,c-diamide adenosyltransferase [Hespellia sp.]
METRGLIHIYCGEGKGKTTAATGLAIRAAGSGMQVLFARFLKNDQSSELRILQNISEIHLLHPSRTYGFYRTLGNCERAELRNVYEQYWQQIKAEVDSGNYQMLILDEIMAVCKYNIISTKEVYQFLQRKPDRLEVVLTGRGPEESLLELADYVSEIRRRKHPYEKGISARKGIEW